MESRLVVVATACLLAGAAVGWFLKPAGDPHASGIELEPDVADDGPQPGIGTELGALRAELESARKRAREEGTRREEAEATQARLEAEIESLRAAATKGTTPDAPVVAKGVRYPYAKHAGVLESIDWDVAGDAVAHITALLKELTDAQAAGKPMPPSVGAIQRYNGPLVTAALTAQQGGMPGTGVNGSFSHPALLANLVHATLLKAGLPLDEAQEKRLRSLADDFVQEDERRLAGYDESTLGLEKLIAEAALKDRFYAAVDALVTEAQRAVLHPPSVRGRTSADLFSSAIIWATVTRRTTFHTTDELASEMARAVVQRYDVPAEQKAVVEDLAATWVKSFPAGYLAEEPDPLTLASHYLVDRIRIAADRQLTFFRAILDGLPADWAGASRLRQEAFVLLPLLSVD